MGNKRTKRPKPNWLELPEHLTAKILSKVGGIDVLNNVQRVCTVWKRITKDPTVWRYIDMHNTGELFDMDFECVTLCRYAVDRSDGQCVSINIEHFATYDLLNYIADRCKSLKHLRLVCCYDIENDALRAVKKLPLLEELELTICENVSHKPLRVVGKYCPLLKSLKLNSRIIVWPNGNGPPRLLVLWRDKQALAIAKYMCGLRHLQLIGNDLTNVGLEAILDGCPNLESLDLRRCYNVNLEGELGKRCAEQIKHLRYPKDSVDDYEFETGDPKDVGRGRNPRYRAKIEPLNNVFDVSSDEYSPRYRGSVLYASSSDEDGAEDDESSGISDIKLNSDEDDVSDEDGCYDPTGFDNDWK